MKLLGSRKTLIIISILLGILAIIVFSFFIFMPHMKIIGDENIKIELNAKYKEKGVTYKNIFGRNGKKVKISGKVNNKKVGTYKIEYTSNYLFFKVKRVREVEVVDKIDPIITLEGEEEVFVCPDREYEEIGYSATDNYDGDLTSKVKVTTQDGIIKYKVSDSSKNSVEIERRITKKDVESPVITLKGNVNMTITVGNSYSEPGYSATDNCDGDLTSMVTKNGSVNTNQAGVYKINYTVKDNASNEATVTRTVTVKNKLQPIPGTFKSSMVYLTFDDGPSSITPKILDILKEEGVKATFFVINHGDSLNYIIKRAYDEGHTIALHSYTHNYKTIYASTTAYFNDLNQIKSKVKNITGYDATIIRFPGGSSNTVSNFNKGIMTTLTRQVTELGYRYFDWNISSGDAGETKNSTTIYNNVIKGVSPNKTNVVLMHDANDKTYTLNALRDIIKTLKNNGYSFAAIDSSTPQVIHSVNN